MILSKNGTDPSDSPQACNVRTCKCNFDMLPIRDLRPLSPKLVSDKDRWTIPTNSKFV